LSPFACNLIIGSSVTVGKSAGQPEIAWEARQRAQRVDVIQCGVAGGAAQVNDSRPAGFR
jgi:hypothetical protein